MGWASGSSLFGKVIEAAQKHIPNPDARQAFYLSVIPAFDDHDWDTHSECEGVDEAFDKALRTLHPDWYEE
jgi:hypothetical protein